MSCCASAGGEKPNSQGRSSSAGSCPGSAPPITPDSDRDHSGFRLLNSDGRLHGLKKCQGRGGRD